MNKTNDLLCAHSGLLFAVMLGLSIFGLVGWLPPIAPDLAADELAAMFEQGRVRIRLGMTLLAFGATFWWTFSAAIAMQMKKIEGDSHPLTYVQMASSTGTAMVVMLAAYFWLVAAFRADTPAAMVQMFSDYTWMTLIGFYQPIVLQVVVIGMCILGDKNPVKRYPRWVGYANLWAGFLFLPGALLPFFKTGPFAWNGIIGFWLVAFAFFGWIVMMWWMTVRAIKSSDA